ncbi:MAG: glycosyltransferase family 4 protein [Candidatus Auribacterota bacterium]|jgi:glycosyltransferase involved in cell wall biosynthesis|nr:glycosyltransferase family 4 protein [Candidatus Auribacterota bacterium]
MKIAYFTGWLRPEMEGTSNEVFALARHFNARYLIGVSGHERFRFLPKDRALGLNPNAYIILKALLPLFENFQQISHIYDDVGCWHYLRNLRKKPVVFSVVSGVDLLPVDLYENVRIFVVDSKARYQKLTSMGFLKEKLRIIYPGIDLDYFKPAKKNCTGFNVLFASAPPTVKELHGRGVIDILETAKLTPDVKFTLLWRPWGDSHQFVENAINEMNLTNVHLINHVITDKLSIFNNMDCMVVPFRKNGGKPCPTSVLEACACGLPVISGEGVEIRDLLANENAGINVDNNPESIAFAIDRIRQNYSFYSSSARACAENFFSLKQFFENYREIYEEVLQ